MSTRRADADPPRRCVSGRRCIEALASWERVARAGGEMVLASVGRCCFAAAVVALLVLGTIGITQTVTQVTQVLVKNGLPKGLLPATVKSYTLGANGEFQVNLRSTCTTKFGGEQVYYKKTITGELSYRQLSNLRGIQVYEAFVWLSVTSINVDKILPKTIWFKVGYFSKALSTDLFKVAPLCNSLSVEEEEVPNGAITFSEWLSMALSSRLEVNLPQTPDTGAARKVFQ